MRIAELMPSQAIDGIGALGGHAAALPVREEDRDAALVLLDAGAATVGMDVLARRPARSAAS